MFILGNICNTQCYRLILEQLGTSSCHYCFGRGPLWVFFCSACFVFWFVFLCLFVCFCMFFFVSSKDCLSPFMCLSVEIHSYRSFEEFLKDTDKVQGFRSRPRDLYLSVLLFAQSLSYKVQIQNFYRTYGQNTDYIHRLLVHEVYGPYVII